MSKTSSTSRDKHSMSTDKNEPKSKAQKKREAEAAQALGTKLVELSVTQINELSDKIDMSDKLHEALLACQSIKACEVGRRQLQYIGKLMRDLDLTPIGCLADGESLRVRDSMMVCH